MISINHTLRVLRNHMRMLLQEVPAGIWTTNDIRPAYVCAKYGIPPICKACQRHHELKDICSKFYGALISGEHQATCPFGINILYLRTDNAPISIGFFLQTGFAPNAFNANSITSLNRVPKKAIKIGFEKTRSFKFHSSNEETKLDLLRRTLETLLAGRVAASMRELTHQLLTPVQGIMSDLQHVKYKHINNDHSEDERILSLMQSNIDEINSIATQVHILLSEDITPTRQRIRKVVVHKVIKQACDRLESVAAKKGLHFNYNYNRGILAVEAVPDQLNVVFRCLLDNAAKYSFSGRSDHKRTIDIRYEDADLDGVQALKVSIHNYGCLITKEEIEKRSIFELGYRGIYSGDKGRQGTGSGLYNVDRIVEAHFGEIEVESKIDGDPDNHQAINTFTVFWPKDFLKEE